MRFSFYLPGKAKPQPATGTPYTELAIPSGASIELLCSEAALSSEDYDLVCRIINLCTVHTARRLSHNAVSDVATVPARRKRSR